MSEDTILKRMRGPADEVARPKYAHLEIEMDDLAALRALPDPPWAVRDVTHELPYQGATLARAGIPKD